MRRVTASTLALVFLVVGLLLARSLAGQAPAGPPAGAGGGGQRGAAPAGGARGGRAPAPPAGPARRTSDGKPDLAGSWSGSFNIGLQNIETSRGVITEPAGDRIPYKPEYAAEAADIRANRMFEEPELHCLYSGVPHVMFVQFGFQIIQTPKNILMTWDFLNQHRTIRMDGSPHINPATKLFMGDSIGRWEGDVLVIDTTNQNDQTWFDTAGNIHSDEIHVLERLTPVDENTIRYEATVTDPKALTQPMKVQETFRRNPNPNWEQMEFACVEGNRDIERYPENVGGPAKLGDPGANAPPGAVTTRGGGRGGAPAGGGGAPRGQQQ